MRWSDCLDAAPVRILIGIASHYGMPAARVVPKAELARRLGTFLLQPTRLEKSIAALSPSELDALHSLAEAPNLVLQRDFCATFGPIRPYRLRGYAGPPHPWRSPASTTESLLYQGLIFVTSQQAADLATRVVVIPDELIAFFTLPNTPEAPHPLPHATPPDPAAFVVDLALWLAYLQNHDVQPLHGRWLSLRHCRTLAPCLSLPSLDPTARSEIQSGRLAFLHFAAEALDLVHAVGGRLAPSPFAVSWLRQPLATQLKQLWSACLRSGPTSSDLWRRYRLPGHTLAAPHLFVERTLDLIRSTPADTPLAAAALLTDSPLAAAALLPWWERETADRPDALLHDVLAGPLTWLGLLDPVAATGLNLAWRRNAWLDWLLGLSQDPPAVQTRQPLELLPDLILAIPAHGRPAGVLALAPWAELADGPTLRITPNSVAAALASGATWGDLLALLAAYAAPPLQPHQAATLASWAEQTAIVRIRPALVIDSPVPAVLDDLASERLPTGVTPLRLSPNTALLKPAQIDRTVRLLRQRGLTVDLSPLLAAPDPQRDLSPEDAAWLVVAVTVYSALARRLPGLAPPPAAVLEPLRAALTPQHVTAVEAAATHAVAAFVAALDDPRPQPVDHTPDTLADRLAEAVRAGQPIALSYWSPWTQETTQRVVHPRTIEWRGDHPYLVAYCELRRAQRTFRLDRIVSVEWGERGENEVLGT